MLTNENNKYSVFWVGEVSKLPLQETSIVIAIIKFWSFIVI